MTINRWSRQGLPALFRRMFDLEGHKLTPAQRLGWQRGWDIKESEEGKRENPVENVRKYGKTQGKYGNIWENPGENMGTYNEIWEYMDKSWCLDREFEGKLWEDRLKIQSTSQWGKIIKVCLGDLANWYGLITGGDYMDDDFQTSG